MNPKKAATFLTFAIALISFLHAQQPAPTSGDVTVRLAEPIDFATARPLQAVRANVVSSTNPMVPAGSFAVLQLQNRDGSYALKLLRLNTGGQIFKTMSEAGVSVSGGPASGQHASLPNGVILRFTLTQQDGSPGTPSAQPESAATTPTPNQSGPSKPEYVLEGIGLGMTRQQVEEAGKAHGAVTGLRDTGFGYQTIKTSDLSFDSIQFNKSGRVWSYTVKALNPKHLKAGDTSGPLYDMAVGAFGQPTLGSGSAKWGIEKVGNGSALYSYDKSEAPNGNLVVSNGLQDQ